MSREMGNMAAGLNWLWPSASQRRAGAVHVCRLFASGTCCAMKGMWLCGWRQPHSTIRSTRRTRAPEGTRLLHLDELLQVAGSRPSIKCHVARAKPMERNIVAAGRYLRVMRRLFRLAIQGVLPGGGRDIRKFPYVSHPGTPAIGARKYANVPIDIKQYGFFHDHPGTFQRSFR